MLAKHGARLCKHLERGGSLEDEVSQMIFVNIAKAIDGRPDIRQAMEQAGIDGLIIKEAIFRGTSVLRPEVVLVGPAQPRNLLSIWIFVEPLLPATLLGLPLQEEDEQTRREKTVEYLIEGARSFRVNNDEFGYDDLRVVGNGGISKSEASGCARFPLIVWSILILTGIVLYKSCT